VTPLFLAQIVLTLFVFFMLLNSAAVMVYVERKVAALLQPTAESAKAEPVNEPSPGV